MKLNLEQQKIQKDIFDKNVWFWGFSEIHGISVIPQPEVDALKYDMKNEVVNIIGFSDFFVKLRQFREYILDLDWYWFVGDSQKIQWKKERFYDMWVKELLWIFQNTCKKQWDQDREYYFALFEVIEDKLEERGIDLGFNDLFEMWI